MSTLASRPPVLPPRPPRKTASGGFPDHGGGGRLPGDDEFLTADEVACMFKLSRATIYRHLRSGRFPRGQKFGRCRRWSRRLLERWWDEGCPPPDRWDGADSGGR